LVEDVEGVVDLLLLLPEKILEDFLKARVFHIVGRVRLCWEVTPLNFMLSLGPRLHPLQAHLNRSLQRLVVTHLEVQVFHIQAQRAAPVAAVERV